MANAEKELPGIVAKLKDNNDWEKQFNAIDKARALCLHHCELLKVNIGTLQGIAQSLAPLIVSQRSALAKNSLLCVTEAFASLKQNMDP